ncbi:MAG: hypothetical protein LW669_06885 [Sphingobacteriales bacterium]|jgi:hypothetical protein|nr:hypothetical protein [Sphingobacteriales bacterium]
METKAHLNEAHAKMYEWVKELNFYTEELTIFQNRLGEIVSKNNNKDLLAELEHFQNQFIRHREVMDTLHHAYTQFENIIVDDVKKNSIATNRRSIEIPANLIDQHDTFIRIYKELKTDFEKFLTKTL